MMSEETIFRLYTLNRRWTNASLLFRRSFDGHIVSMQQSGSHWIKNMLAATFVRIYDLPPLSHIQDDSIIGHTKSPPVHRHIPQIVHSHGYPHALTLKVPGLHYPKYLVLVRDLRESLVSHYERFRGDYGGCSFAEYLRGDVRQDRFHSDIWSRIRFMNEWGRVLHAHPGQVMALRYEDMKADAGGSLKSVLDFFKVPGVTDDIIAHAVAESSREKMAEKPNPGVSTVVVRKEERKDLSAWFTPENETFFQDMARRYLRHDFGYAYLQNREKAA